MSRQFLGGFIKETKGEKYSISLLFFVTSPVDIRVRVSGGGHVSQVYAIRQAIAKSLVAYYAKNFDAASALELRQLFIAYDRTLLIADPRRMEPKKFGGHGARARSEYKDYCVNTIRAVTDDLLSYCLYQGKNHTDEIVGFSCISSFWHFRSDCGHTIVTCIFNSSHQEIHSIIIH